MCKQLFKAKGKIIYECMIIILKETIKNVLQISERVEPAEDIDLQKNTIIPCDLSAPSNAPTLASGECQKVCVR